MKPSPESFNGSGRSNRFLVQSMALILVLVLPFALYAALQRGNTLLGKLFFTLLAISMGMIMIWG